MKISSVRIKNFKAIEDARVPLTDFTVIVGTNGSGKSSILQALHWMLQSARNPKIKPERTDRKGSTLSALDATYMPSPEYKNASHSVEYGNAAAASKMNIEFVAESDGHEPQTIPMWIKSAKNEGISVHVPSRHPLTGVIRNPRREVSAYIPGLAGIPLSEEKRSMRIVQRQAAAGDANTVLRNVLDLLRRRRLDDGQTGLNKVEHLVSSVLGPLSLQIAFDEEAHYRIHATFQTEAMRAADPRRFKPLELAGIGFLQVIQIFAYLVYFQPRLLLVDEPDSHLHPDIQERLTTTLLEAAKTYDCQAVLTTHSPSVVRALTNEASLIWMRNGALVSDNTDEIRRDMGWGLLDKSILLVTEDKKVGMLKKILSQWPELDRKTAVWSTKGNTGLPAAESMAGLSQLFGTHMKVVMHRDGDFMVTEERESFAQPYRDKGIAVWITEGSDIEGYWIRPDIVAEQLGIDTAAAADLINVACDRQDQNEAVATFRTKRQELLNKLPCYRNHTMDQIGTDAAKLRLQEAGRDKAYVGKKLVSSVRALATEEGLNGGHKLASSLPNNPEMIIAADLKRILEGLNG